MFGEELSAQKALVVSSATDRKFVKQVSREFIIGIFAFLTAIPITEPGPRNILWLRLVGPGVLSWRSFSSWMGSSSTEQRTGIAWAHGDVHGCARGRHGYKCDRAHEAGCCCSFGEKAQPREIQRYWTLRSDCMCSCCVAMRLRYQVSSLLSKLWL